MKKLFTLIVAGFTAIAASARDPQVILNSPNDFDVRIDGTTYSGNSTVIPSLSQGLHTVQVYSVKGGFLGIGKKRELVSSTQFRLGYNDVRIDVDQYGQVRVNEYGNTKRRNDDGTYGDGTVKNHGTLQGKGKKLGHYKNNKVKKEKQYRENDNDDNDDYKATKERVIGNGKGKGRGRN